MNRDEPMTTPQNEGAARFLAYFSPYLFWATVCVISGLIWLVQV